MKKHEWPKGARAWTCDECDVWHELATGTTRNFFEQLRALDQMQEGRDFCMFIDDRSGRSLIGLGENALRKIAVWAGWNDQLLCEADEPAAGAQ